MCRYSLGSVSAGVFTRSTGSASFSSGGGGEALGDLSTAMGTYTMAQGLSSTVGLCKLHLVIPELS
jgi:hypothetical protein